MGGRLTVFPSVAASRTIRRSRTSKWRAASLVSIHIVIAAHIAHWLISGRTVTPVEPSEAMAFAKGGMVNAGLIFFAAAILLTAVFGRFFCGWACHLVALQDLSRWLLEKMGIRPQPLRSRVLGWVPTLAFAYMFVWPVAYRLWIRDALGVSGSELTTTAFWETFPGWIVGALTFLVCGFLSVYFLGAKGFCTYACPYGAVFSAAERLAPVRVRVTDACNGCGHCTAVCTSNVRVHQEVRDFGMVVDSGCMKCGDCVSVCPNDALYIGFGRLPIAAKRRVAPQPGPRPSLTWPEEVALAGAFVLAFLCFRGLYGRVPFLMSLGVAGVLAFLVLLGWRLARRSDLAWRHWTLRAGGALTPAGRAAAALLLAVGLLWLHSGAVSAQALLAARDYRATAALRARALDVAAPPPGLSAGERARVEGARAGLERLGRWALFPWRGAAEESAALAYLAGDEAGFRSEVRRAVERGEATWDLSVLEARAAAERGDLSAARAAGERAIGLAPDRPEGYATLGILLAHAGDLETAAAVLERGCARLPAATELLYDTGVVAAMRGHTPEAIAAFERVLARDPGHKAALENLAGMLASAGRFEESAALYRRALQRAPDDLELRVLLAQALAGAGRIAEARGELDRLLATAPDHLPARRLLEALGGHPESPARQP